MRGRTALLVSCAVFFLAFAAADPAVLGRRQDAVESTATRTAKADATSLEPSSTPIPTTSEPPASDEKSDKTTAAASGSDSAKSTSEEKDESASTTSALPSSIEGPAPSATPASKTKEDDDLDELPLHPKVTPALGVAGVFLILVGLVYNLIGIKNRHVQIFLSSAILAGLSVTVLIIYVMNPPVRPAIQGAYLVAIFVTAIFFGAGALIFKEVTEGLGCLLGGFCLSMWLLALRPGGTLTSTLGRVILIAAFTTVTYALSFTHYTRPYALIGATSFAGATAVVLGVDCFAKAGLKEFWLYLWNLNDKLFPLETNTYPHTRGIRVELAIIPLICFIGVVSQLKLWKVIQDRREKKDAIRLEEDRDRDETERDIGRRLEEGNQLDRARWEAEYGDQDENKPSVQVDSGLGTEADSSLRKASVSVREVEDTMIPADVIEMRDMRPDSEVLTPPPDLVNSPVTQGSGGQLRAVPISRPLSESHPHPDAASRLSATPSAGFALPLATHSRGSSVAATLDEDIDGQNFARPGGSPMPSGRTSPGLGISESGASLGPLPFLIGNGDSTTQLLGEGILEPLPESEASDHEEFHRISIDVGKSQPTRMTSLTLPEPNKAETGVRSSQVGTSAAPSQTGEDNGQALGLGDNKSRLSLSGMSNRESLTKGALEQVPSRLSEVVMSYRTNEWAKHLSTAAEPEFDPPEMVPEGMEEEVPAHLVEPPPAEQMREAAEPAHLAAQKAPLPTINRTVSSKTSLLEPGRAVSQAELSRSLSDSSQTPTVSMRGLRHSSGPIHGQTLVTSPIDENAEAEFYPSPIIATSPSPVPGGTLLSLRDSHLRNKQSHLTALNTVSPREKMYLQQIGRSNSRLSLIDGVGSQASSRLSVVDDGIASPGLRSASRLSLPSFNDDDMPLSQRKALMQQQQVSPAFPDTRLARADDFDAHLPKPSSSAMSTEKRMSLLANWKQSMHQEAALNTVPQENVEIRRAEMMMERKNSKMSQQYMEANKIYQDHAFDQAMRRGDMQELHKAAIKKMQADANKHAK